MAWAPLRALFSYSIALEVRGLEHIEHVRTPVILAGNHTNELDPLIIVSSIPFFSRHLPLVFVSREKSFYASLGWQRHFYGGIFFKCMGAFQAYVGLHDYEKALVHHREALRAKKNVCIFPLGKRHLDTDLRTARGGVTYLAHTTNLPILPVRITGIEGMTFGYFVRRKRKVRVTFGRPVYYAELAKRESDTVERNEYEIAAMHLMEIIVKLDSGG